MFISVPTETFLRVIVTCISPGRFGSSNLSVYRMRSCGTSSRYSPPKEWLCPVVKFVNDILWVPPTLASKWCTLPVNPFGGSHLAIASASRKRPIDSLRCRTEHAVKPDGFVDMISFPFDGWCCHTMKRSACPVAVQPSSSAVAQGGLLQRRIRSPLSHAYITFYPSFLCKRALPSAD